jgi:hypothetical protein
MIKTSSKTLSALNYRGTVDSFPERFDVMMSFIKSIPHVRRTVDGDFVHYTGIYTQKRSYALRGKIRDLFHPMAEAKRILEIAPVEHVSAPHSIMSGPNSAPIPSDDYIVTTNDGDSLFSIQCYHFGKSFDSPFWFIVDPENIKLLKATTKV